MDKNMAEELSKKYSGESAYIDRVSQLLREEKL
jgi:hypothetical protein